MTPEEAQRIIQRINDAWPAKTAPTPAQYGEWIGFLQPYELKYAERALDELRAELLWRPTMAHFRKAYFVAAGAPENARPALTGGTTPGHTLSDEFGSNQDWWIYCYKCDGAISLAEQLDTAISDRERGHRHARCPRPGTVPIMPARERAERAERLAKVGR